MQPMPFGSLWMPVLASAIAVFVVSSIMHMLLKYHRADIKKLPNEDAVRDVLGKSGAAPGVYMTPYCADPSEMKQPAMQEKYVKGPIALITVMPNGMVNMPKHLGLWFFFSFIVSFSAAYVARHTLHPGADGLLVARMTGAVAFCAYGWGNMVDSIWRGQPWSNAVRAMIDGFVYSLVTGGVFWVLWPKV
jgi:hypothetical protein